MDSDQYNERWRFVHNMPEEVIPGFNDLGGSYLVPVHWGMFNPPTKVTRLAKECRIKLITPRLGKLFSVKDPPLFDQWWKEME